MKPLNSYLYQDSIFSKYFCQKAPETQGALYDERTGVLAC